MKLFAKKGRASTTLLHGEANIEQAHSLYIFEGLSLLVARAYRWVIGSGLPGVGSNGSFAGYVGAVAAN